MWGLCLSSHDNMNTIEVGGQVHRVNPKYVNCYVWGVSGICSVMEINRNSGATC